jgi:hypothetical protein
MKPLNYYDFLQYFAEPGCLICNLVERDVAKYRRGLKPPGYRKGQAH